MNTIKFSKNNNNKSGILLEWAMESKSKPHVLITCCGKEKINVTPVDAPAKGYHKQDKFKKLN